MSRRLRGFFVNFAGAVLVLASSSSGVLAADLPNACSLLSPAEAAAVLGQPIKEVAPVETDLVSHCGFDPGSGSGAYLSLDVSGNQAGAWAQLRPADGDDGIAVVTSIPGLGDDAYVMTSGPIASAGVLRGNLIIRLEIKQNILGDASPPLPDLARTVIARLP